MSIEVKTSLIHELIAKVVSDRLWALVLYIALVLANASFQLQISEEQMTEIAYIVGGFIAGKTIRGTVVGTGVATALGAVLPLLERKVPKIPAEARE